LRIESVDGIWRREIDDDVSDGRSVDGSIKAGDIDAIDGPHQTTDITTFLLHQFSMPPKGSSKRIALNPKWPRYADVNKCTVEYQRAFTVFKEKHRSTLAFILERFSEWNLRRHSAEMSLFSAARRTTLTRDIADFVHDIYRFRALIPADEMLLMMHHRRQLIGILYNILGRARPAGLSAASYTDNHAELFAPLMPGDSDYVQGGDGERMDYNLEPQLTDARLQQIETERQNVVFAPYTSGHAAPPTAVATPAVSAAVSTPITMPVTGKQYILGPKGFYLERVANDSGGYHYKQIRPGTL